MKPRPPKNLTPAGKAEWDRLIADLESVGTLDKADRAALALYISHWEMWSEATEQVRQQGIVVKIGPNNYPTLNPYQPVAVKAAAAMVRLLVQFGLTPKSRGAKAGKDDEEEAEPLDY